MTPGIRGVSIRDLGGNSLPRCRCCRCKSFDGQCRRLGTAQGFGPFVSNTPLHNAILLQGFIAVTSLTGLILAAVINEREQFGEAFENEKQLLREIESVKKGLEERVAERTHELEQKTSQLASQARLLDLANDAILVRDAAGRITYWNDGAQRLYGWNKEEALGGSTQELLQNRIPDRYFGHSWDGSLGR